MARATSSRIRPGIELHKIVITLDPVLPPTLTMEGRTATGRRNVDQASSVTITTMTLDREGIAFVEHVKHLFSGTS